ncbi:MAG: NAD(P)-dependent oxidoreductase [Clostridia bacterium]|nr:MAG: NAD(P)-dependent oxidoreductase [Clostridia bacterium]
MVILIVGGTGFIGRAVARKLLAGGQNKVIAMDFTPPNQMFLEKMAAYPGAFEYVRGDVSSLDDIVGAVKTFGVEKIVNLAYMMAFESERLPRAVAKVNVLGMTNVFEAARLHDISRVVYATSIGYYGPQSNFGDKEVSEDDVGRPTLVYGITKQLNEIAADRYCDQFGMSIVGLRISNVFGHGRECERTAAWFSSLISLPAVGKPISLDVQPSSTFSLIYVDDVAEAINIMLSSSTQYRVYNTGGNTASLGQVTDVVKKYLPDAEITFGNSSGDVGIPYRVSCSRIKSEFGFRPRSLEDGVLAHINEARQEAGLEPITA